jgi:hypothetical protein
MHHGNGGIRLCCVRFPRIRAESVRDRNYKSTHWCSRDDRVSPQPVSVHARASERAATAAAIGALGAVTARRATGRP